MPIIENFVNKKEVKPLNPEDHEKKVLEEVFINTIKT